MYFHHQVKDYRLSCNIFYEAVLSFSLLYQFVPNIKQYLKDVLGAHLFSRSLPMLATFFFRFYVENFGRYGLIFGSLSGILGAFFVMVVRLFLLALKGRLTFLLSAQI